MIEIIKTDYLLIKSQRLYPIKTGSQMTGEYEHTFMCPYCGAQINMILEQFYPEQEYIEDCEVCCNPIKIYYKFQGEELVRFEATTIGQ